jgi:hypothetical protein
MTGMAPMILRFSVFMRNQKLKETRNPGDI